MHDIIIIVKISDIGEFTLLQKLKKITIDSQKEPANLIIGIGDDAAVWQNNGKLTIATTDCLIENIHFKPSLGGWYKAGQKAVAASISDIAAMGGTPIYILVSLGLPAEIEVSNVEELYRGILKEAGRAEAFIVGGNISKAPVVSLNLTIIGHSDQILRRNTAQTGDLIALTGNTGLAAAGLEMLQKNIQFEPEAKNLFTSAFLTPQPRTEEGKVLSKNGIRASIDISDGLVSDLQHLVTASKVGAVVNIDKIPIHPLLKANFYDRSLELALCGGEDYELLFTGSEAKIRKIEQCITTPINIIGYITTDNVGKVMLHTSKGTPFKLRKSGWEHFATP